MESIIAFLRARFDEDERIAQAAASEHGPSWITGYPPYVGELVAAAGPDKGLNVAESAPHHVTNPEDIVRHAAHWDPERALGEVAFKRELLHWCERSLFDDDGQPWLDDGWNASIVAARQVLESMAVLYAAHSDYDPAWAPVETTP